MGISDRLYNLAKSYLDSARSRWDEVDAAAQKELNETASSPALAAWERAQARITAATASNQAAVELRQPNPAQNPVDPPAPVQQVSPNALTAAYKILDVPPGSELLTVQKAYQDTQKKADPTRFPQGSKDRQLAEDIQRRVNTAYMLLVNALSTANDDRFDRLEL